MINTGLTSVLLLILSLLELTVVSRSFSVSIFGQFATFLLIVNLLNSLFVGVLNQFALRRNILIKPSLHYLIIGTVILQLPISLVSQFLLINKVYLLESILLLFFNLNIGFYEGYRIRVAHINKVNLAQLISVFLSLLFIIGCAFFNLVELRYLVWGAVLKSLIHFILIYEHEHFIKKLFSFKGSRKYFLKVIFFYRGFLYSSLTGYFYLNLDKWLVVSLLGSTAMGAYTRVLQLLNVPIVLLNRIISKDIQSKLLKRQKIDLELKVIIFLSFLICGLGYFFSDVLVLFVLGEAWFDAGVVLKYGLLLIPLKVLQKIIDVKVRAYCDAEVYSAFYIISLSISVCVFSLLLLFDSVSLILFVILSTVSVCLSVITNYFFTKFKMKC